MNTSVISRLIPDNLAPFSNRSTGMRNTLCSKFSISLHLFIVCCAFQISPDYHVSDTKINTSVCFLIQHSFFTPSHCSSLARSISAPQLTNSVIYALTRALTYNAALSWWPESSRTCSFPCKISRSTWLRRSTRLGLLHQTEITGLYVGLLSTGAACHLQSHQCQTSVHLRLILGSCINP